VLDYSPSQVCQSSAQLGNNQGMLKKKSPQTLDITGFYALVAQLDRVLDYE
jgi:hypothetical protein